METPNAFVQFVDDWLCYNSILGEGAYGEVRLLVHATTDEKLACKIIDHSKYKDAATAINREVTIHSLLRHENIIRYFGRRQEPLREFIFLEYASGGELFQMIEPDVGMASKTAQTFMKHLLNGLEYLHKKGVAHRDIKPENLLIDGNGILKITDFGLATIFRVKGKERLLDKKCGTKPYLAPEVLKRPYHAEPADLWSCGIVFVAMLTGELPWSDTTDTNPEYTKWKKDVYVSETPWSKLGNTALSLARQLLNEEPEKRLTLSQITKHSWMRFSFDNDASGEDCTDGTGERAAKRWRSMVESETKNNRDSPQVTLSQPVTVLRPPCVDQLITSSKQSVRNTTCFSQPVRNDDVILYLTQSPITRDNFDKLVKRMTRFYVMCAFEHAVAKLCSILDSMHYNWTSDIAGSILVSTVDCMKNQLSFRISVIKMDERILIDFRLAKGCGLEFKKKFVKIKMCVQNVINDSEKTTQQTTKQSDDSESQTETSNGQEELELEN